MAATPGATAHASSAGSTTRALLGSRERRLPQLATRAFNRSSPRHSVRLSTSSPPSTAARARILCTTYIRLLFRLDKQQRASTNADAQLGRRSTVPMGRRPADAALAGPLRARLAPGPTRHSPRPGLGD